MRKRIKFERSASGRSYCIMRHESEALLCARGFDHYGYDLGDPLPERIDVVVTDKPTRSDHALELEWWNPDRELWRDTESGDSLWGFPCDELLFRLFPKAKRLWVWIEI